MDILRNLRRLESGLTKTVEETAHKMGRSRRREPLEVIHAIIDAAEKRIEPAGRGKYLFPFNRIHVFIAADTPETRARFEAVFGSTPTLRDRVFDRLKAGGCEVASLSLSTNYVDRSESDWPNPEFNVGFDNAEITDSPPVEVAGKSLTLTIIKGTAERSAYVFESFRVNLGRCPEVRDNRNRLIRTNHVAFEECTEGPNLSISRQHAHIECPATPGVYRLCDDRSAHGTSLIRNGKTIPVPAGPRGVRLQPGDLIVLGEAQLRIGLALLPTQ
jgi:hypothetical protein